MRSGTRHPGVHAQPRRTGRARGPNRGPEHGAARLRLARGAGQDSGRGGVNEAIEGDGRFNAARSSSRRSPRNHGLVSRPGSRGQANQAGHARRRSLEEVYLSLVRASASAAPAKASAPKRGGWERISALARKDARRHKPIRDPWRHSARQCSMVFASLMPRTFLVAIAAPMIAGRTLKDDLGFVEESATGHKRIDSAELAGPERGTP